jgi:predicted DNA-binding WGR domain protein
MRAFLKNDASKKYWEIETEGPEQLIRTSKLGGWGRSTGYKCAYARFDSSATADADSEKKRAAQLKRGYVEFEPASRHDDVAATDLEPGANDVFKVRRMVAQGFALTDAVLTKLAMGSIDVLKDAVSRGSKLPDTVLRGAALNGQIEIVRYALELGLPVDARDDAGETALMLAARYKENEVVKVLLESGADANLSNQKGVPVVAFAGLSGDIEILELVCANGADLMAKDKQGRTPLGVVAQWARKESKKERERLVGMCRHLIRKGCQLDGALAADLVLLGVDVAGTAATFDDSHKPEAVGHWRLSKVRYFNSADDDPAFEGPRDTQATEGFIDLRADGTATVGRWMSQPVETRWSIHQLSVSIEVAFSRPVDARLEKEHLVVEGYDEEHGARYAEIYRRGG